MYVSRTVKCEYCGNQRSTRATAEGLAAQQYDAVLNFETSEEYDHRQKAALAYAEAISWRLEPTDDLWDRLHQEFSEAELVELGCFIALTLGQQSGSGCSASTTTSTWLARTRRWRRASYCRGGRRKQDGAGLLGWNGKGAVGLLPW